jgi:hypothetical protein
LWVGGGGGEIDTGYSPFEPVAFSKKEVRTHEAIRLREL